MKKIKSNQDYFNVGATWPSEYQLITVFMIVYFNSFRLKVINVSEWCSVLSWIFIFLASSAESISITVCFSLTCSLNPSIRRKYWLRRLTISLSLSFIDTFSKFRSLRTITRRLLLVPRGHGFVSAWTVTHFKINIKNS